MAFTALSPNRSGWIDILLGAWLIAAPFALRLPIGRPVIVAETLVPGIFLIATSAWILMGRVKVLSMTWVQMLAAFWLIVGSFVLLFRHLLTAALDGFVLGLAALAVQMLAMLALTAKPDSIA